MLKAKVQDGRGKLQVKHHAWFSGILKVQWIIHRYSILISLAHKPIRKILKMYFSQHHSTTSRNSRKSSTIVQATKTYHFHILSSSLQTVRKKNTDCRAL